MIMKTKTQLLIACAVAIFGLSFTYRVYFAESSLVKMLPDGSLEYKADVKGNTIPDFSNVSPAQQGSSQQIIQDAIDEVSTLKADANGYRGTILLKKGTYLIPGSIHINQGGIVLKGEGNTEKGTRLVAEGKGQRSLLVISGSGSREKVAGSEVQITDDFVPVGTHSFQVESAAGFKVGDKVVIYRPATQNWITDLKMDQIEAREGLVQWEPKNFGLSFERVITSIKGNQIFVDAPVVMQMDKKYGGGSLYKYTFAGRIAEVGVENIYFESAYASDTDEDHGWRAVDFGKAENCWVNQVTSRYFGYSCVHVSGNGKNITVKNSKCLDAKSQITGGRRYSFNVDGQLNLVINCETTEGRHDYVTGAQVCGPNVFYNCRAAHTHADIGPHHRWAVGTLYDNISTDGEIMVQDRGNYGTGHGWSGVTQVLWNCTAKTVAVQNPWVSGTNYCIGLKGEQVSGRFKDRQPGIWEAQGQTVKPMSLYMAQLKARLKKK
jgi:hypothetical protein